MESELARSYNPAEASNATCCPSAIPRETILLVEDEAFVRDVIEEVLQTAGYHVLKTQGATEALQTYNSCGGDLHLLLTDVVMPGESGRDLARKLRSLCPGMRTIFMSGYGESVALLGAERDASVFYLSKPFSLPGLLQKIEEVLRQHQYK
ncbi:MAG TPA: response regulator [Terriglobales bacterium]|jgi:CheY-like chemotaxis protein